MSFEDINETISYTIDNNAPALSIKESREFYLSIIQNMNDAKEKINKFIIEKICKKYGYVNSEENTKLSIRIVNKTTMESKLININDPIFFVGRHYQNDIQIGQETTDISRIQFVTFEIADKRYILDTWSLAGTTSIKLGKNNKISSIPYKRNLLSFNKDDEYIIDIPNYVLIFNQDNISIDDMQCIVCMSKPRRVRFECGHGSTCIDCTKLLFNGSDMLTCPLCRSKSRNIHISECVNIMKL